MTVTTEEELLNQIPKQPVPGRALAISVASLAMPVAAAIWLPEGAGHTLGTLTWLTALIPAFLLAYYRGFAGVAVALAGGMAVITATQISIVAFGISEPDWPLLAAIVGVYLGISLGIGALAELLRRERRAAEEMALLDRLTGLPNRRHADMVLEREFASASRGGALAVVIFDLDKFKAINDRFGHAAGDRVLQGFARVLEANTRRSDLCARFGGEEFIGILRDADAKSGAIFAKRVLDRVREMECPSGRQTVSAGVAAYEDGMGSYEVLVGAADRALYQAKAGGRDMVCVAAATAPTSRADSMAATITAAAAPPAALLAPPAGELPLVYVVDDDAAVLAVVKRMLDGHGMVLWTTTSPDEAIRHFAEALPDDRPALIITDIIMPSMTGMRMMEQIAEVKSDIPVIYMSGYVHGEISWNGMAGSVVGILEKPLTPDKMREAVNRALAGADVGKAA